MGIPKILKILVSARFYSQLPQTNLSIQLPPPTPLEGTPKRTWVGCAVGSVSATLSFLVCVPPQEEPLDVWAASLAFDVILKFQFMCSLDEFSKCCSTNKISSPRRSNLKILIYALSHVTGSEIGVHFTRKFTRPTQMLQSNQFVYLRKLWSNGWHTSHWRYADQI